MYTYMYMLNTVPSILLVNYDRSVVQNWPTASSARQLTELLSLLSEERLTHLYHSNAAAQFTVTRTNDTQQIYD